MAKDASTLTLLECSEKQRARYQEQAKKCPTPFLYKALKLMNECDINYRQSHNKRLLTELTLIQVAQLTQPDEETPGAGRRPAKRLKPIFTHVTVEVRPVAQGVAAANVRTPQNDSQPSAPAPTAAGAAPQGRPAQPVLKISSLGSSVSRMRQMRDAKTETKVYQVSEGMNSAFDQTLLGQKWLMMCNRMPESEVAMSQRMKMMTPSITDYPAFEVVVDNDVVLGYMEKIKGRIVATLAQELHNSSLQMTLRLATHEELKKKALTRMEVFNAMVEGNKAVAKLKEVFGLELA
jgi:DNA polymerase-3 subunit gamma/tau